jgi:hypothetical protein
MEPLEVEPVIPVANPEPVRNDGVDASLLPRP